MTRSSTHRRRALILLLAALASPLAVRGVTVQEVMLWHELGLPEAVIGQRVADSQPPARFSAEELAGMTQAGAPATLVSAIQAAVDAPPPGQPPPPVDGSRPGAEPVRPDNPGAGPGGVGTGPPQPPGSLDEHGNDDLTTAFDLDVEEPIEVGRIEIHLTSITPHRPRLVIEVSDDGKTWRQVYVHDGRPFGAEPLVIRIPKTVTRKLAVKMDPVTFELLTKATFGPD